MILWVFLTKLFSKYQIKNVSFSIENAYEDYDYNLYKKDISQECIIIAKKINLLLK